MSSTRGDDILRHAALIWSSSTSVRYDDALMWAIDWYASTRYST